MANLFGTVRSVSRVRKTGGNDLGVQLTPDGALYVCDWLTGMALEGRVIHASVGTATTPITFKTGYTTAQPELAIDVPSGTAVALMRLEVHAETSAGTINEITAVTGTAAVGAGTSTVITPLSTRTDRPITSACSVYSAYSGNGTAPANPNEFWRAGYAFADTTVGPLKVYEWTYTMGGPQIVIGAGTIAVYVGATTTAQTGYIKAQWVELPSSYYIA